MKKIIPFLICFILFSTAAVAKRSTFIYTNNRLNYVKLEEIDKKEAEKLKISQPVTFSEDKMESYLASIRLDRSFILKKEVKNEEVFSETAIKLLSPKLVEAFQKAKENEKIVFSYLEKDPIFIIRNDHVTVGYMWASGNELHIKFEKILAQLNGDYDKRGNFTKEVARAKGLRIQLSPQENQTFGEGTDEIVIDTSKDFSNVAANEEPVKEEAVKKEPKKVSKKVDSEKETVAEEAVPEEAPKTPAIDRLRELDELKNQGMISNSEYKKKRKEILKGL